jgi:hypothetical protein
MNTTPYKLVAVGEKTLNETVAWNAKEHHTTERPGGWRNSKILLPAYFGSMTSFEESARTATEELDRKKPFFEALVTRFCIWRITKTMPA